MSSVAPSAVAKPSGTARADPAKIVVPTLPPGTSLPPEVATRLTTTIDKLEELGDKTATATTDLEVATILIDMQVAMGSQAGALNTPASQANPTLHAYRDLLIATYDAITASLFQPSQASVQAAAQAVARVVDLGNRLLGR